MFGDITDGKGSREGKSAQAIKLKFTCVSAVKYKSYVVNPFLSHLHFKKTINMSAFIICITSTRN